MANPRHVMLMMGTDFAYQEANIYYTNMDKLIKHVNEKTAIHKIHVMYSTPACFTKVSEIEIMHNEENQNCFQALNDESVGSEDDWSIKNDNGLPFAEGNNVYTSG